MARTFALIYFLALILVCGEVRAGELTRDEAKRILGFMGCADAQISVLTNGVAPAGFSLATGQGVAFVGAVCSRDGKDVSEEHTFIYDSELGWMFYEKKGDTIRRWTTKGYQEVVGPTRLKTVKSLQEFGIVGRLARDCTKPGGLAVVLQPSPMIVIYTESIKDPRARQEIETAEILPNKNLRMISKITKEAPPPPGISRPDWMPSTDERWENIWEKADQKIRIAQFQRVDGGKVAPSPLPTYERCND